MMVPKWMDCVPRQADDWPTCVPNQEDKAAICARVKSILLLYAGKTVTMDNLERICWDRYACRDTTLPKHIQAIALYDARYAIVDRACRALGANHGYSMDA